MKKWRYLLAGLAFLSLPVIVDASPNYNDPIVVTGTLERYGDDFYIGEMELELGDDDLISYDYNQDGKKRPIEMELYEMVGTQVTVKGYRAIDKDDENEIYVIEINGQHYPNPEVRR